MQVCFFLIEKMPGNPYDSRYKITVSGPIALANGSRFFAVDRSNSSVQLVESQGTDILQRSSTLTTTHTSDWKFVSHDEKDGSETFIIQNLLTGRTLGRFNLVQFPSTTNADDIRYPIITSASLGSNPSLYTWRYDTANRALYLSPITPLTTDAKYQLIAAKDKLGLTDGFYLKKIVSQTRTNEYDRFLHPATCFVQMDTTSSLYYERHLFYDNVTSRELVQSLSPFPALDAQLDNSVVSVYAVDTTDPNSSTTAQYKEWTVDVATPSTLKAARDVGTQLPSDAPSSYSRLFQVQLQNLGGSSSDLKGSTQSHDSPTVYFMPVGLENKPHLASKLASPTKYILNAVAPVPHQVDVNGVIKITTATDVQNIKCFNLSFVTGPLKILYPDINDAELKLNPVEVPLVALTTTLSSSYPTANGAFQIVVTSSAFVLALLQLTSVPMACCMNDRQGWLYGDTLFTQICTNQATLQTTAACDPLVTAYCATPDGLLDTRCSCIITAADTSISGRTACVSQKCSDPSLAYRTLAIQTDAATSACTVKGDCTSGMITDDVTIYSIGASIGTCKDAIVPAPDPVDPPDDPVDPQKQPEQVKGIADPLGGDQGTAKIAGTNVSTGFYTFLIGTACVVGLILLSAFFIRMYHKNKIESVQEEKALHRLIEQQQAEEEPGLGPNHALFGF